MRAEEYDRERLEMWKAKLNAPLPPPLEATRKFLSIYFCDADGWDDAAAHLRYVNAGFPKGLQSDLKSLELLLANPPREAGVLADLVAWEANWVLEDPSDEGAKEWLRKVAEMVREILGDAAPPRPKAV